MNPLSRLIIQAYFILKGGGVSLVVANFLVPESFVFVVVHVDLVTVFLQTSKNTHVILQLKVYIYIKLRYATAMTAKSLQSCPTLCDSIDGSPPGSPVPGILHARILEWVAISSPMHESEK